MRVLAMGLTPSVSITLAQDEAGWRFVSWSDADFTGGKLPDPPAEAREQRFAAVEDALDFFRALALARVATTARSPHRKPAG